MSLSLALSILIWNGFFIHLGWDMYSSFSQTVKSFLFRHSKKSR